MSRFAAQTRELCPESDEHHEKVWFCLTCKALESRLTPISEALADLLADESLTVTLPASSRTAEKDNQP